MNLRPMKATRADLLSDIRLPTFAQPKYDGIRCLVYNSIPLSNTLKPIRNPTIAEHISHLNGFDGELVCRSDPFNFQKTVSVVMSSEPSDDFLFMTFDVLMDLPFEKRRKLHESMFLSSSSSDRVQFVQSILLRSAAEIERYETDLIQQGYEGIMLRSPEGRYKLGRSTLKEQHLLKRKPFVDDEAVIVGFGEQQENQNEQVINNLGLAERSSSIENRVGKNTLGYFKVRHRHYGEFNIGTGLGLSDSLRSEIWNNQHNYLGKIITFKYQKAGTKDKPRIPIFLRFRPEEDLVDIF